MAVNATAIWRVRPSGVNTNGGGYDPGIAGAATDYSQQNAAQATGTNGSGSATTTFTDATASAFTSAMVGNAINITGQGTYFVVTFTSATQVVVDRTLGTFSGATWHLGGGWADWWTNCTSSGPLVPGNNVFVLGSGIPNPSAYTTDYTYSTASVTTLISGSTSTGKISWFNDPATPSYKSWPDTTGGMPVTLISNASGGFTAGTENIFRGMWFNASANFGGWFGNVTQAVWIGCVWDCIAATTGPFITGSNNGCAVIGCESFASSGGGFNAPSVSINGSILGCNFHDLAGSNCILNANGITGDTIVAKCGTVAIRITGTNTIIKNCTIDGNTSHGIGINSSGIQDCVVINNIISNQTGGNGINLESGTAAANDAIKSLIDFNSFYNNSANYNAISAGVHDTALLVTPYVASSTENYTLA